MPILKEGSLLKNDLLFNQTDKEYYCTLCFGNWIPSIANSESIFSSEVLDTRVIPTITTGWDEGLNIDFVNIEFQVSYPQSVVFNRLVIFYGGYERSKYQITFAGFNSVTLQIPTLDNPFVIDDRVLIDNRFYKVISKNDNSLGVEPIGNSPNLPTSGSGILIDSTGIPLVASVLDDVFEIQNDNTVNFLMTGSSI